MSCLGVAYDPNPPREWSRVQHACTYPPVEGSNPAQQAVDVLGLQLKLKGNVLQYKKNSANFTQKQIYNQIAQGKWINRNTTWAVQTQTFTNPNTQSLKRVGYTNLAVYPQTGLQVPTTNPISCPPSLVPNPIRFPPSFPPKYPASASDLNQPIVIPDGGKLICNTRENICTGEMETHLATSRCYPTSDSNVPGEVMYLCWNEGDQTWYPRQRYVMTNSANKFPVNAPLFPA